MKITDLKKQLKDLNQKELITLIADLYKLNSEVKDYLSSKFSGEEAHIELHEKARLQIRNEFFPDRGHGKLRLTEAKKAISTFKKLVGDPARTLDLMLYYVELGTEFTNTFGDIDMTFYNSLVSMYDKAAVECDKDVALVEAFHDRFYRLVRESEGIGWGYSMAIEEIYYSMGWDEEDADVIE
ncbi:DUF6155 family protein [Falsibacillus pallidus]|uniref:Uncharacterized protein n=1 Tax=Falsibacillus pallidus TaxID=493781 RepID=A0A370GIA1_9BACI|nr:DUF6155 family protein [Falsibacillus pallidus]RDI41643.1 hypothetical protein DFR59_10797 [Falsibacillus pallidus]